MEILEFRSTIAALKRRKEQNDNVPTTDRGLDKIRKGQDAENGSGVSQEVPGTDCGDETTG